MAGSVACKITFCFMSIFIIAQEVNSSKTSKKLKLADIKSYSDVAVFTYQSKTDDNYFRFHETAKALGYLENLQTLECQPDEPNCLKLLYKNVEKIKSENTVVLLLNPDQSLLNCPMNRLAHTFSEAPSHFIISDVGLESEELGLQLIADKTLLNAFLKDNLNFEGTLLQLIRSKDRSKLRRHDKIYFISDIESEADYFRNIENKTMGVDISANYVPRAGAQTADVNGRVARILVQPKTQDLNSTSALDQVFNLFIHPQFRLTGKLNDYPTVLVALTIEKDSLFLPEFLEKIESIDYPKDRLDLYVACFESSKMELVSNYVASWKASQKFRSTSIEEYTQEDFVTSRQKMLYHASSISKSDFIFFVRSTAHIENAAVLKHLVECNKAVIAPLLLTYEKIRLARVVKAADSKWNNGYDKTHSFYQASLAAGYKGISDRFLYGTNFVLDSHLSKFWTPLRQFSSVEQSEKLIFRNEINHMASTLTSRHHRESLWRVRAIKDCYLMRTKDILAEDFVPDDISTSYLVSYTEPPKNLTHVSLDEIFSARVLLRGMALHILNHDVYGQIVNMVNLPRGKIHPELFRIFENHDLWERRYILSMVRDTMTDQRDKFPKISVETTYKKGKCPDTLEIPMMTEKFCDELVSEAENFNEWFASDDNGTAKFDPRYNRVEHFPAYDTSLARLDLEEVWVAVINFYFPPRRAKVFPTSVKFDRGGHFFIIRYRPDEQPDLKPHDDNSLYTMNVALNHPGIDFEGGGTRFVRYECSVPDLPKGHVLLHPGKLTHYHEGLATTKGTRYVLISFVNANNSGLCYEHHGEFFCDGMEKIDKGSRSRAHSRNSAYADES